MAKNKNVPTLNSMAPAAPAPDGAPAPAKVKKIRALRVPMQADLRAKLEEVAKSENITPAQAVRNMLATAWGITLETAKTGGATKKYDSPEERKAASKERRATKAALLALLVSKHAGDIDALKAEAAKIASTPKEVAPSA